MPLTGTLKDLNLFSLVQLQCSEKQHAQVFLKRGKSQGRLAFAEGELVFASVGALTGEEAVRELLTWDDAEFRVDHAAVSVPRNVHTPWLAVLLDGMRTLDETRAGRNGGLQVALQGVRGSHGLNAMVVVDQTGHLRAAATEGPHDAEAALAAFLAGRLEVIGGRLNCGAITEALFAGPAEKVWIMKENGSYLVCWLEGGATVSPIKALLQPLLTHEKATGES